MSDEEVAAQFEGERSEVPHEAISVSAPEYDMATQRWMSSRVRQRMREMDEVYASIQHESMSSTPATTVQFDDQAEDMVMQPVAISGGVEISVPSMIDGEFDHLYGAVDSIAEQHLKQTMDLFASTMNAVTERTGKVFDATGRSWVDTWISALDQMEMKFNEDGMPDLQTVMHPSTYEQFREQLAAMTPEQHAKLTEIMARKKAEFDATRRHRRLPRHGY